MNSKTLNACLTAVVLASPLAVQAKDNWAAQPGTVWRSADQQCWRDAAWTPQTAAADCGGAAAKSSGRPPIPVPPPKVEPAPAPVVAPAVPVAAPAAPKVAPPPAPAPTQRTLAADALFDVDKAEIKPAGMEKIDKLAAELRGASKIESILIVGHTDSKGSEAYNQRLSERRAQAVRQALEARGVPAGVLRSEGRGEAQPVADNRTKAGRAANRRVDIEVRALVIGR